MTTGLVFETSELDEANGTQSKLSLLSVCAIQFCHQRKPRSALFVFPIFEHINHHTLLSCFLEKLKLILFFCCQQQAEVDHRSKHDCTPLHLAALRGNRSCVESLVKYGANIEATTTVSSSSSSSSPTSSLIVKDILCDNNNNNNDKENNNKTMAMQCECVVGKLTLKYERIRSIVVICFFQPSQL